MSRLELRWLREEGWGRLREPRKADLAETLIEEAMRIAEGMESVDGSNAEVTVG